MISMGQPFVTVLCSEMRGSTSCRLSIVSKSTFPFTTPLHTCPARPQYVPVPVGPIKNLHVLTFANVTQELWPWCCFSQEITRGLALGIRCLTVHCAPHVGNVLLANTAKEAHAVSAYRCARELLQAFSRVESCHFELEAARFSQLISILKFRAALRRRISLSDNAFVRGHEGSTPASRNMIGLMPRYEL